MLCEFPTPKLGFGATLLYYSDAEFGAGERFPTQMSPIMKPPSPLRLRIPVPPILPFYNSFKFRPFLSNSKLDPYFHAPQFPLLTKSSASAPQIPRAATSSKFDTAAVFQASPTDNPQAFEETIEKVIYRCRFLTLLAVFGSLTGSILCFIKGCAYIVSSFMEYFVNRSKVILLLVEAIAYGYPGYSVYVVVSNDSSRKIRFVVVNAILVCIKYIDQLRLSCYRIGISDIYLLGTVMLVFGMGLYELFVSNLDIAKSQSKGEVTSRSNLFGLFALKERPRWLEIKSVSELKAKLGHDASFCYLSSITDVHEDEGAVYSVKTIVRQKLN
ncbi:hypothetical protein CCACVL1_07164 [Corchorus capsularis]|uniref:Uncharacterized protein n=1 Tax=Corchorus capsularis TaxID=210143 RepID=A0A1R3J971_COCAP|nr:hypothetical protein CCACVL1_07164 [Corchorus capsularis]